MFFAQFMCFEVPSLAPSGGKSNKSAHSDDDADDDDDDLGIAEIDDNDKKTGSLYNINSAKVLYHFSTFNGIEEPMLWIRQKLCRAGCTERVSARSA